MRVFFAFGQMAPAKAHRVANRGESHVARKYLARFAYARSHRSCHPAPPRNRKDLDVVAEIKSEHPTKRVGIRLGHTAFTYNLLASLCPWRHRVDYHEHHQDRAGAIPSPARPIYRPDRLLTAGLHWPGVPYCAAPDDPKPLCGLREETTKKSCVAALGDAAWGADTVQQTRPFPRSRLDRSGKPGGALGQSGTPLHYLLPCRAPG
jgi:hypothetical protein